MKPQSPRNALSFLEQRKDLNDVYKNIQEDLDRVEDNLKIFSDSSNRLISEISTYLFQKKGKRIRPALLVLCSKLLDYQGEEHVFMAALVEFIHTASLIHDDIIDNASFRRGRESVHTRWGPNISVLLGDFLYIKTIGLSLQSQYPQIIRILTDISTKMIEGELTEYHMSGNLELGEEDYFDIIHKKTAALFSASCQIGGILGQASPEEESSLIAYGSNLGMTFQIIDDLLDFKGDEKNLGKPTLSDLGEGRITLPLIYTLNNDGNHNRRRLLQLLREKNLPEDSKRKILEIIKSNGALDYTYKRAEDFSLRSREVISQFPESAHREALSLLSEFVLTREI
jgi:octaprenyl-diphosphate synthase